MPTVSQAQQHLQVINDAVEALHKAVHDANKDGVTTEFEIFHVNGVDSSRDVELVNVYVTVPVNNLQQELYGKK